MENLKPKIFNQKSEKGQTLIETLAALFILVMGVSAATSLAVYALNSSTNITKQIIGTGLAREGLEAVRNMRDTNWLKDTMGTSQNGNGCYDYNAGAAGQANCFPHWLGTGGATPFCINPSNSGCAGDTATTTYALAITNPNNPPTSNGALWNLVPQRGANQNYGMTYNQSNSAGNGFYLQDGNTVCGAGSNPSGYCRKITIVNYSTGNNNAIAPYDKDNNLSLLLVQSQVWWVDKTCPLSLDWPGSSKCSVELDTYLTNWKNY